MDSYKLPVRIIPRLDIKGPNLVKGVHLEGLRILGKPEYYARYYYENGADELFYVDSVASLYGRNNLLPIIERTAKEIFIPLTVGGGLTSFEDIQDVLRAGADKVSINTAAIKRPEFIKEAARRFGSSTIVVSITTIWHPEKNKYVVYTDYGREDSDVEAISWAQRVVELGAGELIITSIDREGTGKGFDLELIQKITESVSVPVIVSGGTGEISHISEVVRQGGADAVGISSLIHYECLKNYEMDPDHFLDEGNIEFLKNRESYFLSKTVSLRTIKEELQKTGINCRPVLGEV